MPHALTYGDGTYGLGHYGVHVPSTVALVLDLVYEFSPTQEITASVEAESLEATVTVPSLEASVQAERFEVDLG